MKLSTWVILIGGVIALVDFQPTLLPNSITGGWNSNTQTGTGLLGILNPIDNKLPVVQNVGVWIVAVGVVMRFGFDK